METNDQETIERIFHDALQFGCSSEQKAFLDRTCVDELEVVRDEVESLLKADQRGTEIGFSRLSSLVAATQATDFPPTAIGPYRLLEKLGEGGMGVVYKAQQDVPLRRFIAIKLAKPWMDSKQILTRFDKERQTLAMMDHPYIAKIFDAGSIDSGSPYFAMELVDGQPITDFCDVHRLDVGKRLALFLDVCEALQHAHQKGIVHRDIKPSNVLVTVRDGRPVPKVIDFGLAKAWQSSPPLESVQSSLGQIIGTLEYMSPEQAQRRQADIDTRTDIYSLGALLYELLSGKPPLESRRFQGVGLEEMIQALTSSNRPSLSSSVDEASAIVELSNNRRTSVPRLKAILTSDLEVIVMKALSIDRAERYGTVSDFANDVRNYVQGRPVLARRPSRAYEVRKFVERNRISVAAISCFLVLLFIGLTVSLMQWSATVQQRMIADANRLAALAIANVDHAPNASVLLALEAYEIAHSVQSDVPVAVVKALQTTTQKLGGIPLNDHVGGITNCIISHDDCWMLPIGGRISCLWDLSVPDVSPRQVERLKNVNAATFSRDGKWLVTGDKMGVVRVWELNKGGKFKLHQELIGHNAEIGAICICPNSRLLFSCDGDGKGFLWNLAAPATQATRTRLSGHTDRIDENRSVAFGPHGRWLAIASQTGGIGLWSLGENGEPVGKRILANELGTVDAVVISPSGRWLAVAADKTWLWDLRRPNAASSPIIVHPDDVTSVAISLDEKWLVAGAMNGTTQMWDLTAERPSDCRYELRGHKASVFSVAIGPHSRWLVTGSKDRSVRLWDLKSLEHIELPLLSLNSEEYRFWDASSGVGTTTSLHGHDGVFISALAITNDGTRLVSTDRQGGVRLWNLETSLWRPSQLTVQLGARANKLELSPDGKWLVVATDSRVLAWRLHDGLPSFMIELKDTPKSIRTLCFSNDSRWLATSCSSPSHAFSTPHEEDHTLRIWDVSEFANGDLKPLHKLDSPIGQITSLAFASDDTTLVSGGSDGVCIWRVLPTKATMEHELFGPPDNVHAVAISHDCRLVASAGRSSPRKRSPQPIANCFVWNLATPGKPIMQPLPAFHGNTGIVAFSPDQQFLVYGGLHDELRVADVKFLNEYQVLQPEPGTLAVDFSADGNLFAESGWQVPGTINLWARDRNSHWNPLCSIPRFGAVNRLVFDASGTTLLADDIQDPRAFSISPRGVKRTTQIGERSFGAAISPDGRWAIIADDHQIQFNDLDSAQLIERARKLVGRDLTNSERRRFLPDSFED